MPISKPYFRLYESDGTTLVYTFPIVQETNAPQSNKRTVVIEGQRGKGAIVVDGGEPTWELYLKGVLWIDAQTEGYEELVALMDAMESAITPNTPFVLRIDKTSTTYYEYHVKRIEPINYESSLRTDFQRYEVRFLVNSW